MLDHSKLAQRGLWSGRHVSSQRPLAPPLSPAWRVDFCFLPTAMAPHLICLRHKLHFTPVPIGSGGREVPSMHESPMFSFLSCSPIMRRLLENKLHTSSKRSCFFAPQPPPTPQNIFNFWGSNWIRSICHVCCVGNQRE